MALKWWGFITDSEDEVTICIVADGDQADDRPSQRLTTKPGDTVRVMGRLEPHSGAFTVPHFSRVTPVSAPACSACLDTGRAPRPGNETNYRQDCECRGAEQKRSARLSNVNAARNHLRRLADTINEDVTFGPHVVDHLKQVVLLLGPAPGGGSPDPDDPRDRVVAAAQALANDLGGVRLADSVAPQRRALLEALDALPDTWKRTPPKAGAS